jgi:hypothetical protein
VKELEDGGWSSRMVVGSCSFRIDRARGGG